VNPVEAEKTGFFRVGKESFIAFEGLLRDETSRMSVLFRRRGITRQEIFHAASDDTSGRVRYRRHFCKSHELRDGSACVLFPDQRHHESNAHVSNVSLALQENL